MLDYDVVIVGSGIAGMTAAIYLKRANKKVLLVESDTPGGELNKIWKVENYPGYVSIEGSDLAYNIYKQVNNLEVDYIYEKVENIDTTNNIIKLKDKNISYKYLIIATGRRAKGLGLPNEEELIGRGVSYCALCDGNLYKNREVVVVGGGNTALNDTLYLSNIVKKVTLIHRKDELRGEESTKDKLNKDNIEIIYNSNIVSYDVKDNDLVSVTLDSGKVITCRGVFLDVGSSPNSEIIDVKKDNGYIIVDDNYRTSLNNVYAIGDVIKKDVYQLTTASSDATIASYNIINNKS
jgi:thioredoxin reductase (NADPH)